jgi:hypothetical protein
MALSAENTHIEMPGKIISYFPKKNIALFISEHLDLASFPHSLNFRRDQGQRTFRALGFAPTKVTENRVEFVTDDWTYEITVVRRGDLNFDGIEDVEICYTDVAIGNKSRSSYATISPYVLTRYSSDGYVLAISYKWDIGSACNEFSVIGIDSIWYQFK